MKHYPADRKALEKILEDILAEGQRFGLNEKAMNRLQLISEELIVNVMNYGYENGKGEIQVALSYAENGALSVSIISGGKLFNPLEMPIPDTTQPLAERAPGGLGIFLSTTLSDSIKYQTKDGRNMLTFTVKDREGEK